jgi:hypothetical protein
MNGSDFCRNRLAWIHQLIKGFCMAVREKFNDGYLNDAVFGDLQAGGLEVKNTKRANEL